MKKNVLKWLIYTLVILLILFLGTNSYKRMNNKRIVEENIQKFHDFCTFSIGDNQEFCAKSLANQPIMILFMHPECDFCQAEIKQLKEFQTELQNISVLLITSASLKEATDFYSIHNLVQFSNMQLLLDENYAISNYFDVTTIPTVFLYNKDKNLILKHKGEIKVETLIKYLSEK